MLNWLYYITSAVTTTFSASMMPVQQISNLLDVHQAAVVLGRERQLLPRAPLVLDPRPRAATHDHAAAVRERDVRVGTLIKQSCPRSLNNRDITGSLSDFIKDLILILIFDQCHKNSDIRQLCLWAAQKTPLRHAERHQSVHVHKILIVIHLKEFL